MIFSPRRSGSLMARPFRNTVSDLANPASQSPSPARGYASHGESWSLALALRLASFALLRDGREDPVLILDDVFAELDTGRRDRLAARVDGREQVLITAAVPAGVPSVLAGARFNVSAGVVCRAS